MNFPPGDEPRDISEAASGKKPLSWCNESFKMRRVRRPKGPFLRGERKGEESAERAFKRRGGSRGLLLCPMARSELRKFFSLHSFSCTFFSLKELFRILPSFPPRKSPFPFSPPLRTRRKVRFLLSGITQTKFFVPSFPPFFLKSIFFPAIQFGAPPLPPPPEVCDWRGGKWAVSMT